MDQRADEERDVHHFEDFSESRNSVQISGGTRNFYSEHPRENQQTDINPPMSSLVTTPFEDFDRHRHPFYPHPFTQSRMYGMSSLASSTESFSKNQEHGSGFYEGFHNAYKRPRTSTVAGPVLPISAASSASSNEQSLFKNLDFAQGN